MEEIIIIGAGAAGLCAAWELAKNHVHSVLVSDMPSERAQSNMAEGGINAAFLSDTDSPELHAEETLRAGRYLADAQAVHDLAENAPNIIEQLFSAGMSFSLNSDGKPDVRAFGGQSVKRTFYVASGGLNGMFGNATGSVRNTGAVSASLFADGVAFANGEFIQYHPTTVPMHGKHLLITEAVRGESGRLFALQDGKPFYFMEEKYPELGNLMPRDVIAREEWMLLQQGKQIWLDMRHLDKNIQQTKLRGVLNDCSQFLSLDPTKKPIPVVPGIHYFMGGIWVDRQHRTTMRGLYASGECACQYHGANRLGGNSLLGAIYGGTIAANLLWQIPLKSRK